MTMNMIRTNQIGKWLPALIGLALLATSSGKATDNRAPAVPPEITIDTNQKVHFHGFARGVQIYTWDGSSWGPAVPDATLFDEEGEVVATHFAGPTWKSNSGSTVVGTLMPPPLRVTVDTNSIPWLLLTAARAEGPGIFADTTFIHRVNTHGGKAPSVNGTEIGEVARMPYTADYFFYRRIY